MAPPENIRKIYVSSPEVGEELTLEQYRAAFHESDRPSDEQIENFIEYVANAHSWYKHLPLAPPGAPFWFFIDPAAGLDILPQQDGSFLAKERIAERGFHYNHRSTQYWRSHFGFLQFHSARGTSFLLPETGTLTRSPHRLPMVFMSDGKLHRLPPELDEGRTDLNGIIHKQFATEDMAVLSWAMWAEQLPRMGRQPDPYTAEWSLEYGGNAVRDAVALMFQPRPWTRPEGADKEYLADLIERIRMKQFDRMRLAMRRVRALVFGE